MKNRLPFFFGLLVVAVAGGFFWVWWELHGMKATLAAFAKRLDATVSQLPLVQSPSPLVISSATTSDNVADTIATLSAHVQQLDREFQALLEDNSTQETPAQRTSAPQSSVKETLVFMGSGSSSSTNWTNISSAQVTINTAQFPPIKEVRLEAALSILGGEAHARLVRTDGTATYLASEVMHNTSTSTWVTSAPFSIAAGNVSYTIQVRSTSNERVNLDGARLKLIFE